MKRSLPKLIPRFDSWKRDSQFKKLRECRSEILKAEDTDRKSITVNEQMQTIEHDMYQTMVLTRHPHSLRTAPRLYEKKDLELGSYQRATS